MTLVLATAVALATASSNIAFTVVARSATQGELLVVTLTTDPGAVDVRVRAFDQLVPAFKIDGDEWQAVLGIDVEQRPGTYPVVAEARIRGDVISGRYELKVAAKHFATRRLKVAPEFVDPPPAMAERIAGDTALLSNVYAHSAAERLWKTPFIRPVPDRANSRFGTRSIINGKPRNPHTGTDFLSASGVRIKAPNSGRVVVARDLYFSGNTVVIDHGLGVFSLLAHLSQIDVKEGQTIDAGEIVGLVGATGRVTGPHLHWALRAAGARVDPLSALYLLGKPRKP
jgi:murein DD-endopeptidase MepM/ murein hydrolase activator NlpD